MRTNRAAFLAMASLMADRHTCFELDSDPAPAPGPEPVEMRKNELVEFVKLEAEKAFTGLSENQEKRLADIARDVCGKVYSERMFESRHKATTDFAQMEPSKRAAALRGGILGGHLSRVMERDDTAGRGALMSRYLPLYFRYKGDFGKIDKALEKHGHEDLRAIVAEHRALSSNTIEGGGGFIPAPIATDFIAFLHSATVVLAAGPVVMDLSKGNLTIGRQNTTVNHQWIGETQQIVPSSGTYGQLKLIAKQGGIFVPIPNQLINRAEGNFEALVRTDMQAAAAVGLDSALLRGAGTEYTPKGLRNWAAAAQLVATTGTSHAQKFADLLGAQYRVARSLAPRVNPWFFLSIREKFGLANTLNAHGDPVFQMEMAQGRLMGDNFADTDSIPSNLGGGTESEIIYAEMSQVVYGDEMTMQIDTSDTASWFEGGNQQHAFQQNMRVTRLLHGSDQVVRRDDAVSVITETVYGASLEA